jgi:hypothetical protein
MKYYIKWNYDLENIQIVKKRPKNKKIIKCNSKELCSFNGYKKYGKKQKISSMNLADNITHAYILIHHESGQGGDYHNEYIVIICASMDELIDEASPIYDCEHDCEIDDSCQAYDNCTNGAMNELKKEQSISFCRSFECSLSYTIHKIKYKKMYIPKKSSYDSLNADILLKQQNIYNMQCDILK